MALASADPSRALAALTRAIDDFRQSRRLLLPAALYERGRVLQSLGRVDEAIGDLDSAVAAVEQQRDGVDWRDVRSGALDGADEIYTALAALLLRRDAAAAFAVADRAVLRAVRYLCNLQLSTGSGRWFQERRSNEIIQLVNAAYGARFRVDLPAGAGRTVGYTDWTHATWDAGPAS
jgi:tetratricopeptide (TPR) repeat protein